MSDRREAPRRMVDKLLAEWFLTDRWMGSSAFLLPIEPRGLYREMLTQAWRRGARLPNNHEEIRRATGTTPQEWKRCWPRVQPFWRIDGEYLVNDTQQMIYADALGRAERASERGLRGAQALHGRKHVHALIESEPPSPTGVSVRSDPSNLIVTDELADRGARFLERYDELYSQQRHGAKHFRRQPVLDHTRAIELCRTWPDERLDKLAVIFLTTDDDWISHTDRGLAVFASKATWCDERLAAWESQQKRSAS